MSPDTVAALRHVAFLNPLPLPTIERLAAGLERRTVRPGVPIVEQGSPGHEFFVLLDGEVEISVDDVPVDRTSAPSSFGEVALLHDGARTATVSAATECTLAVIRRGPFLDALRRSTAGHRSAMATAARYRRDVGEDRSATIPEE